MSKFKVGDKVRRVSGSNISTPIGFEGKIKRIEDEGNPITEKLWFSDLEWGYNNHPEKWELVTEGPVRTVTRREVVGGVYGDVGVSVHPDGEIQIEMRMLTKDAKRVLSAAMILSQIAEALDNKWETK